MANKKNINLIEIVIIGVFIVLYILTFKLALDMITTKDNVPKQNKTILKVNKDIYDSIGSQADYGTAISLDEPGFGKNNPFEPLK